MDADTFQRSSMDPDEYQRQAARTLIGTPDWTISDREAAFVIQALFVGTAAAKLVEYVKKAVCHRHGLNLERVGGLLDGVMASIMEFDFEASLDHESIAISRAAFDRHVMSLWNAAGLLGEAGETAASVVAYTAEAPLDAPELDTIAKELGDVCWYAAALATKHGLSLGDILRANIAKLRARYPDGWDAARSHHSGE